MANLELHNPEDTCSFASADEYNAFMAPLWGQSYEKLSDVEFAELRQGASCPLPGQVEVGVEATYTPTGRGPEPGDPVARPDQPAASVAASTPRPAVYPEIPCPPGYECIAGVLPRTISPQALPVSIMWPRMDLRGMKVIAGGLGLVCAAFLGYLIRKGM